MQLFFQPFYRQHGIRRVSQMLTPRLATLRSLPRDSVVHFFSEEADHHDLDVSKPYYGVTTKKIAVDYVTELTDTSTLGNPRRKQVFIRPMIRDFHRKNKKFRYIQDALNRLNDQNTLFVLNYSYLDKFYVYPQNILHDYYRFYNAYRTIFSNISKISESKMKNHFIFVDIPKELPSYAMLNMFAGKMSRTVMRLFHTHEDLFMLQIWQWLSDQNRENTIFADLKKDHYSKTNLVFNSADGRSVVMNLGYVDGWIRGHEHLSEDKDKTQLKPIILQKLYLKLNMTLKSTNPEEDMLESTADEAKEAPPEDLDEAKDIREEQADYEAENDEDREDSIDSSEYTSEINGAGIVGKAVKAAPHEDVTRRQEDIDRDIDVSLVTNISMDNILKDLDKDLEVLDKITSRKMKDKGIHLDKNGDEIDVPIVEEEVPIEVLRAKIFQPESVEDSLKRQIEEQADFNLIGASDYKRLHADIAKYNQSKDPYGSGELTIEALKVEPHHTVLDPEKTKIATLKPLVDGTMAASTLQAFDEGYVKTVQKKDTLAMVGHLQKAGVVLRNHEIETEHSALGSYEYHTLELKPIDGQASTLRLKLPLVADDGTFTANSNKYNLRKQRVELPIRKINPNTVALTSYYGQTFVSINEKATSYLKWLERQLNLASMDDAHPFITQVAPAKVFDNKFVAPYIYNALASNFKSIDTKDFTLVFDHSEREKMATPETIKALEKNGCRIVGLTKTKQPIIVDEKNNFYYFDTKNLVPMGDIVHILKLDANKAPIDHSDVKIFGKNVPVGLVLAYVLGFRNLVRLLGAKYRVVEGKRAGELEPHEYAVKFADRVVIFDRREKTNSLILAGMNEFEKEIRQYPASEFNKKNVYLNLMESKGLGSIYIRELELQQQLFVDPITHSILERMKEPVTFNGLLIRSTEMLQTYHHPDSQDTDQMRFRGYERFPGAIYSQLVKQIRAYKNKNIAGKSKIEMSPYQIWQYTMTDSAIKLVEDINPIQNLKEQEIVTFVGNGGRNKDAINRENRAYHENDMGVVSESTVDSSDVGVNAFLSANPNLTDMRGLVPKDKSVDPANLLSTSGMLAPGVVHDDPKRMNFVGIQQSHTIAAKGYHQPYVRTGYEYVIGNRTGDLFASYAKQDGKVVSLNDSGVVVEYKDGTKKGVALGRSYGKAEGSVYPHDVVPHVKLGQAIKKGDPIAYNKNFFEPDHLDPRRLVFKNSLTAKVAFMETLQTHEDSCSISPELGELTRANTTKIRSFTLDFTQSLLNVLKVGDRVDPKTSLMTIVDEITSSPGAFDQKSLEVLNKLANQSPKANYLGVVDKIEVFYHGDKKDMSASLKALADRSDRVLTETLKSTGKHVYTGQVNDDYRVSGLPLSLDKAEVKIYITIDTPSHSGDKLVFANQMKSVIGQVRDYEVHTEDGEKIDAEFGWRSVAARIVESPQLIGTTTTLLKVGAKRTVQIYRNKKS